MKKKIIIFGNGEIADLAHQYFTKDSNFEVVGFTADSDIGKEDNFKNLPLVPFEELEKKFSHKNLTTHPQCPCINGHVLFFEFLISSI